MIILDVGLGQKRYEGIVDNLARANVARETKVEDPTPYDRKAMRWVEKWRTDIIEGSATVIFRGERVNTPTYKTVYNSGVNSDVARVFPYGIEKNELVAVASTAWKETFAKKTVEKVCYAAKRSEIEEFSGVEAAISNLLKDRKGNWLFDEQLNYIGKYDQASPMTVLIKVIDDKIADLRNKTVVDIGQEFRFITEAPYGYYKNYICMAAVALAFRRYIGKMYLADQGSLITPTVMRDIVNAAFAYWHEQKSDSKLRVRFSTAEEKELIELIQQTFGVKGDGISETKWQLRSSFEKQYKSPLWSLKYVVDKGDEFNKVVDSLFSLANAAGDNITQDDISVLLKGLKKQKTSIALTLEKVEDSSCLIPFINSCLDRVQIKLDDYTNLLSYLRQNLSDEVVFWKEDDVNNQILQWCILQSKSKKEDVVSEPPKETGTKDYPGEDDINNGVDVFDDDLTDSPEFPQVEFTKIKMGKTHATIESTTALIDKKELDSVQAKEILKKLCKEYPVVCSAVLKLLGED